MLYNPKIEGNVIMLSKHESAVIVIKYQLKKRCNMLTAFAVFVAISAAYVLLGRNQEARRIEDAVKERRDQDLLDSFKYGKPINL